MASFLRANGAEIHVPCFFWMIKLFFVEQVQMSRSANEQTTKAQLKREFAQLERICAQHKCNNRQTEKRYLGKEWQTSKQHEQRLCAQNNICTKWSPGRGPVATAKPQALTKCLEPSTTSLRHWPNSNFFKAQHRTILGLFTS